MNTIQKCMFTGLLYVSGMMYGITVEDMVRNDRFIEAKPELVARYKKALYVYNNSAYEKECDNTIDELYAAHHNNNFVSRLLALQYVSVGMPDESAPIDILSGNKSILEINEQILQDKWSNALHQRDNSQEHQDFWNAHVDTANAYFEWIK